MRNFDILNVKLEAIQKVGKTARTPTQSKKLVELAFPLLDELLAQDRYAEAVNLAATTLAAARNTLDRAILDRALTRMQEIEDLARTYDAVQPLVAKLDQQPTDPEANLAIGRFQCLVKGDWAKGLPMLAAGSDAAVSVLAARELHGTASAIELADGWWSLADNEEGAARRHLRTHAATWYQQALPSADGQVSARAQQRIHLSQAVDQTSRARQ